MNLIARLSPKKLSSYKAVLEHACPYIHKNTNVLECTQLKDKLQFTEYASSNQPTGLSTLCTTASLAIPEERTRNERPTNDSFLIF